MPFPDNPLDPSSSEILSELTDILHEIRPHVVITHAPYNYPYRNMTSLWDNDHSLAGQLVLRALQRTGQPDARRQRSPLHVAQVYYIGVEFGWTDIDLFVDISDQVGKRLEAEALMKLRDTRPGSRANASRRSPGTTDGSAAPVTLNHSSGNVRRPAIT